MDAAHPTQATKITAGWIRTGEDKAIKLQIVALVLMWWVRLNSVVWKKW
ncbi:MAG: hypothetical protein ACI9VT_003232 [Psychroserpens sp.]|jgi:hypothetical protein